MTQIIDNVTANLQKTYESILEYCDNANIEDLKWLKTQILDRVNFVETMLNKCDSKQSELLGENNFEKLAFVKEFNEMLEEELRRCEDLVLKIDQMVDDES